jgi:hypothetical protein
VKYFQKIAGGVDVLPILHSLQRMPDLWNTYPIRTQHPGTPHSEVDDILVRFQALDDYQRTGDASSIIDAHESVWFPASRVLPVRPILFDLMRRVEGERLGRVMITRLRPGKRIAAHVDGGEHAAYYDRYHVTLQALPGFVFRCGDEAPFMAAGEVWHFNNAVEHELTNNSADDRITMIVDIRHSA